MSLPGLSAVTFWGLSPVLDLQDMSPNESHGEGAAVFKARARPEPPAPSPLDAAADAAAAAAAVAQGVTRRGTAMCIPADAGRSPRGRLVDGGDSNPCR